MHRLLRWTLRIVVVLAVLVAVIVALVPTPWFKDWIRRQLVKQAAASVNGDLQVGSLSGSLWYDVTLGDVVIRQQGRPVVEVKALRARYDPVQLIAGRIALDALSIDSPVIHVVETPEGWNVSRLIRTRQTGPETAPRAFAVRQVTVTNGDVFVAPLTGAPRHATALSLDGGFSYTGTALAATLKNVTARDADTGLPLHLAANVGTNESAVTIDHLDLATPRSHLVGHGAYQSSAGKSAIDTAFDLQPITLGEFAPYLPAGMPEALVIRGSLRAAGSTESMTATWQLDTNAGGTSGHATLPVQAGMARIPIRGVITVSHLDPAAVTATPSLAGRLNGTINLDGTLDTSALVQSSARFDLDARDSSLLGYDVATLSTRGTLDDGRLRASGSASAYAARATFDLTLRQFGGRQTPAGDITGILHHLDLTRLPRRLGAPAMSTDVSGGYTAAFGPGRITASLSADESRVQDAVISAGTFVQADVRGHRLEAQVRGHVARVSGEMLRVPVSKGPTAVGGDIDGTVRVSDITQPITPESVEGDVVATLDGSTIAGETLTRAGLAASLAAGQLEIRRLEVNAKSVTMNATGVVAVGDTAESDSDLAYVLDSNDLSTLPVIAVANLHGLAHLEGRIQGPFDRLTTSGTYSAQELKYADTLDALTVGGTIEAALPDRDPSRLVATIKADSALLTIDGQEIRHLTLASTYQQGRVDVTTRVEQKDRAVDLDGSLIIEPAASEVRVRQFVLAGAGEPWRLGGNGEAVIRYGADQIDVQGLSLVRGLERIDASGRIARTADAPQANSSLTVHMKDVQVADLYTLLLGPSRASGTANGSVTLSGALSAPQMDASLSIVNGQVANVPYSDVTGTVHMRDKRVNVDARVREPAGAEFAITGDAPVSTDAGAMNLHVVGSHVSLGLAQAFTDQVQNVAGQAGMDLHVAGTIAEPALTGQLSITNGSVLVVPLGVTYRQLTADVAFDGRRALVRQLSLVDNDGKPLTVTGGADVFTTGSAARALDLRVRTDGLHVLRNNLGVLEVTSDLHASGDLAAPRVEGQIEVTRGVLEADEWLRVLTAGSTAPVAPADNATTPERPAGGPNSAMTSAPPTAAERAAAAPARAPVVTPAPDTGLFSRASIAVDIDMPENMVLRGRDLRTSAGSMGLGNLNLTIGGKLQVRKSPGQTPEIVGGLEAIRGFYDFQGRRFQIVRGSAVSFRGVDPTNPSLAITGQREISGVVAQVQVTGTVRRPTLKLSSEPPLDEGDVLSLIVFNQSMNDLGEGEQVDLMQRASDMAVSAIATPLADSIGRALDVDLFEIRTPTAGQAGEVNVGRQVNDRLFVGFKQQFGESDASRLSFEYRITEALRVLTSVAQGADRTKQSRDRETTGVDFMYVLRY